MYTMKQQVIHRKMGQKTSKMDLYTKLYTLSTENGDDFLVYIVFFQNMSFGEEYQNVEFCNKVITDWTCRLQSILTSWKVLTIRGNSGRLNRKDGNHK